MRVVLVSGGVISGVGKASSSGLLLKTLGLRVTSKTPRLLSDPLTIQTSADRTIRHGECFVLADGGETDLDLGNYERYLGIQLSNESNMTTGKIYKLVLVRKNSDAAIA
ncbi:CTP synthase [Metarhizium anisopliae]|nr:CTP synthase [Metarhizium anisopliae]